MGKVKGKHRLDKFYYLAKEQGYRSRAACKLLQLESKFSFLNSAHSVLDLCAAPGGWMQVAVQRVPVGSFIIGVDLFPIKPIRGAISVQEDITTQKCRATIKRLMADHGCRAFDLVLHDGSPNVGGAWAQEATSQASLVVDAVKLATEFLRPNGTFVTKIFRSQDYNAVIYCLKQLFGKVEVTKPLASRSTSAEIYVVGLNYKAPAKIDPRLLDVKHLFQGIVESRKVVDVLGVSKQKRHRDGYEDGVSTLRKVCLASDFVWSESALDILGSVASISFDDSACLPIKDHSLTTDEVKFLCDDIPVLGKQDFKHLLKWRMLIRKALSPTQKVTVKVEDLDNSKGDEDDRILNEMEELTNAMDRKQKREQKRLAKRQAREKRRKATGMQIDALEDGYVDQELFSLSSIKGMRDLEVVDSTEFNDEKSSLSDTDNEEAQDQDSPSDVDSEEEHRRYDEQLEEFFDEAYDQFVTRTSGTAKRRRLAKQAYDNKSKELLEDVNNDDIVHSDQDSDKEQADSEVNPLMVSFYDEDEPNSEQLTERWFSQDIFAESLQEKDLANNDTYDEMDDIQEEKQCGENMVNHAKKLSLSQSQASEEEKDFDIVPAPVTESSDDSSDSDEEDVDTKATILAIAKKMLWKKSREHILDDSFNKNTFDDEGLPAFFVEDEKRHRQPNIPVTKEEMAAMRAQFKEINARPAKKVVQAKARKKRVAMRKLEKVRKKANTISDQTDINERSKSKLIDQLYKKAMPKKPKKEYVVAKKGVQVKALGKGKVLVDRRMKKDMRSNGTAGRHGKGILKKGRKPTKGKTGQRAQKGFRKIARER